MELKNFLVPSYALCDTTRARGCQPLLARAKSAFPLAALPCVVNGTCPYKSFRCRRGHKWSAVPGSPVCFYCPKCKRSDGVSGESIILRNNRTRSVEVNAAVQMYARSRGGICLSNYTLKLSSKVDLQCKLGHTWTTRAAALLREDSWCPICFKNFKFLHDSKLHETASHFNGYYLGPAFDHYSSENDSIVTVSQQLHSWRCKYGHVFIQRPNNIRRSPKSKRPCSWCPDCRKSGRTFEWQPKQQYIVHKNSIYL